MNANAAKKLFFAYDGSVFHMDRDGVYARFLEAGIDRRTQAGWLRELTRQKVARLDRPDNWKVVYFLKHHGIFRFLTEVADAEPRGNFTQRIVFLEELLAYAIDSRTKYSVLTVQAAIERVIDQAKLMLNRARVKETRARIQKLVEKARRAQRSAVETNPAR